MDIGEERAVPRFYTNHATVHASPFDFVVEVGMRKASGEGASPECTLVMSPQMAKVLAQLLSVSVQQWESKNGEIKLGGQFGTIQGGPKVQPS